MAEGGMLSTGELPLGGLPRKNMAIGRITVHPDMISAVYRRCKATNHTNKTGQEQSPHSALSNPLSNINANKYNTITK